MKRPVRGIKISLQDLIDSTPANTMFSDWIVPVKATVLSAHAGTITETEDGTLYLVPQGDWFRSDYYLKGLPQISHFNQLQDFGMTEIKDKLVRNPEKVEDDRQEVRGKNNVRAKKADKAMASDSEGSQED